MRHENECRIARTRAGPNAFAATVTSVSSRLHQTLVGECGGDVAVLREPDIGSAEHVLDDLLEPPEPYPATRALRVVDRGEDATSRQAVVEVVEVTQPDLFDPFGLEGAEPETRDVDIERKTDSDPLSRRHLNGHAHLLGLVRPKPHYLICSILVAAVRMLHGSLMQLPAIHRTESLAQRAYRTVREAIRDGRLSAGEIYSEQELGTAMGISRTPVREALLELSREGLVEILPQRGFRLHSPTREEISEVFGLRRAVEGYVVAELASRASEKDIERLRDVLRRQEQLLDDAAEFLLVDEEFHLLMPQLMALERSHRTLMGLRGVMWLEGRQAMMVRDRAPAVLDEHVRIVDAIERHDAPAAVKAVHRHLDRTLATAEPDTPLHSGAAEHL
jgi:DNA-binding GntR family transcriptional regulator